MAIQRGLGKGLDALLPRYQDKTANITTVSVSNLKPNKYQARKKFNDKKISELAQSIKSQGLTQPIVVTSTATPGEYEIIAGERRWRAAQLAGLKEVPVVVRTATEREKFLLSLTENIQREDLNPIEEASAYKQLIEEFGLTQEEIAKIVGKDRSVVANTIRLLSLPDELKTYIENGVITAGHGRSLASISEQSKQKELLKKIIDEQLSVRDLERIISEIKSKKTLSSKRIKRSYELVQLESELQQIFGTKVKVKGTEKKGKIVIDYYSLAELERIVKILKRNKR